MLGRLFVSVCATVARAFLLEIDCLGARAMVERCYVRYSAGATSAAAFRYGYSGAMAAASVSLERIHRSGDCSLSLLLGSSLATRCCRISRHAQLAERAFSFGDAATTLADLGGASDNLRRAAGYQRAAARAAQDASVNADRRRRARSQRVTGLLGSTVSRVIGRHRGRVLINAVDSVTQFSSSLPSSASASLPAPRVRYLLERFVRLRGFTRNGSEYITTAWLNCSTSLISNSPSRGRGTAMTTRSPKQERGDRAQAPGLCPHPRPLRTR